jgi:hypothetical protein
MATERDTVISGKIRGEKRAALYSNSISKVKQGDDERTTKAVQIARLGVSEEGNAVLPKKWDWNYLFERENLN